jgi:hypothetical protein
MTPSTAYCTILARNYLPKAIALAHSLERHHPGSTLSIMLIDVPTDADLPDVPHAPTVELLSTAALGLSEQEVRRLATIYDLVEFATAIKPLLLGQLLEASDQAVYLDPDTYVTSPMEELAPAIEASAGGIVLTPHFFAPVPEDAELSDGHLLHVGVYNLGFCAVDRRSRDFLDWWWGHLRSECLHDHMAGLFVDQKWVDLGSALFSGEPLHHRGYNVSVANLHERPVGMDENGYVITSNGDRLRLFHFHAFDPSAPDQLTTRLDGAAGQLPDDVALESLCREYADVVLGAEEKLPPAPPYRYWNDTAARPISRHLRRVWRLQDAAGQTPPSPFLTQDARSWDQWRRGAWTAIGKALVGDVAKSVRLALPDEYAKLRRRFPRLAGSLRDRYASGPGVWGSHNPEATDDVVAGTRESNDVRGAEK